MPGDPVRWRAGDRPGQRRRPGARRSALGTIGTGDRCPALGSAGPAGTAADLVQELRIIGSGSTGQSGWIDLDGPVHYIDFGGPRHGPVIVCVHGLGGSAVNWSALAPLLTDKCRLLAVDLAGHGLTRPGRRGTDVAANRALLHRFVAAVAGRPVILMGNSMGGMICALEGATAPGAVAGLILVDPALPFMPARPDLLVTAMFALGGTPIFGRALAGRMQSLPPETVVSRVLALCCADPARVPPDVVSEHVRVVRQRAAFTGTGRDMAAATRSVIATASVGAGGRAYRRAIRSINCPVLLLHGERDRLVPVSAARAAGRAHPSWSVVVLPGVGHVPQLEAARECADAVTGWLASSGLSAATAATRQPLRSALAARRAQGWRGWFGSRRTAAPPGGAGVRAPTLRP